MADPSGGSSDGVIDPNHLQHYGVKGMRWGIIRDRLHGGTGSAEGDAAKVKRLLEKDKVAKNKDALKRRQIVDLNPTKDHRDASRVRVKAKVSGVKTLTNDDLQVLITRMNLERQFVDLKQAEEAQTLVGAGKRWAGNFVTDVLKDASSSWLKRPGSNASGRTSGRARAWVGRQPVIDGVVTQRAITG